MSTVSRPKQKPEILPGRPSQVISTTDVRVQAVKYTDGDGHVGMCLALCFGKEQKTGLPAVYVIEAATLPQLLSEAQPHIAKGIRERLLATDPSAPVALPSTAVELLSPSELGEL